MIVIRYTLGYLAVGVLGGLIGALAQVVAGSVVQPTLFPIIFAVLIWLPLAKWAWTRIVDDH